MAILTENEIKSPYDLREMLWYVIPGATLLLLVFLFEYWFAVQIRGVEGYNKNDIIDSAKTISKNSDTDSLRLNGKIKQKVGGYNETQYILLSKLNDSLQNSKRDYIKNVDLMNHSLKSHLHTPIFTALSVTHTSQNVFGGNWAIAAVYLLLILTICYILGHLTYIIGTFIYERGYISKGYCYPYLKLLGLPEDEKKNNIEIRASQGFYRGLYFWIAVIFILMFIGFTLWGSAEDNYNLYKNILLLICMLLIIIPLRFKLILYNITYWLLDDNPNKKDKPIKSGILFYPILTIVIIFLMHLFSVAEDKEPYIKSFTNFIGNNYSYILYIISATLLIEYLIRIGIARNDKLSEKRRNKLIINKDFKGIIPPISETYQKEKLFFEGFFIKWYNFAGNEIDRFFNNYFRVQKAFEQSFIKKYEQCFESIYKESYKNISKQNYWLSKLFVMENSNYLNQTISFWENIYRFTKSLSAAFFLATVYSMVSFMMQYREMHFILNNVVGQWILYRYVVTVLFLIPIIYFVITVLVIQYYVYVYDNRYSRLVLRSFVSLVSTKSEY